MLVVICKELISSQYERNRPNRSSGPISNVCSYMKKMIGDFIYNSLSSVMKDQKTHPVRVTAIV